MNDSQMKTLTDFIYEKIIKGDAVTYETCITADAGPATEFADYEKARESAEKRAVADWGTRDGVNKLMSRSMWEKLPSAEQSRFLTAGGKVFDDNGEPGKSERIVIGGGGGRTMPQDEFEKLSDGDRARFMVNEVFEKR